MSSPILPQAWEDIASDVTGSIEKAVQPLLKKSVDEIYSGLLETTQDYLADNLAFNIASRISTAEHEAEMARYMCRDLLEALADVMGILARAESNASGNPEFDYIGPRVAAARAALAKARGQ